MIFAEGVDEIRVLGGTRADTLNVVSTLPSDTDGLVDGDRVELSAGAEVLEAAGSAQYRDYQAVIGFDGLAAGTTLYTEDGFTVSALAGNLARDDSRGAAASFANGTGGMLTSATGALSLSSMRLASSGTGTRVVFTGTTINGVPVQATVDVGGVDDAGLPVFRTSDFTSPLFGALASVSWTVQGPGSLLVDDIVARAVSGGAAPTVAPVAVPQTAMTPCCSTARTCASGSTRTATA